MDIEKFTERARGFIQSAQSVALREGHPQFTPEHLLKVLIDDEEGLAARLINAAGGRDATRGRELLASGGSDKGRFRYRSLPDGLVAPKAAAPQAASAVG